LRATAPGLSRAGGGRLRDDDEHVHAAASLDAVAVDAIVIAVVALVTLLVAFVSVIVPVVFIFFFVVLLLVEPVGRQPEHELLEFQLEP
jgi:hypothetical protein